MCYRYAVNAQAISIIVTTFPSLAVAQQLARELVDDGHAACVNLVPQMQAIYQWEGQRCESEEVLAFMKTAEAHSATLMAEIAKRHPYTTPEILALSPHQVNAAYAAWVCRQTATQR